MKCKIICLTYIIFFVLNSWVWAENTGPRKITQMGCHLNDGTCYVKIDGEMVGPESCNYNSIRWNKDTTDSGKETLSLLMTAFAAGYTVNFNIIDTCYGSFPTFNYINVIK